MKRTIAIVLILSITLQVGGKLLIAGWFMVNRQQLTELFCINKQKPESKCNGNCYLSKKLKQTDQETGKDSSAPVKVKSGTEETWIFESRKILMTPVFTQAVLIPRFQNHYSFLGDFAIFQPPRV